MQMIFQVLVTISLAQVSRLHGGAQLENSKYTKKCNVSAMYGGGS